MLQVKCHFLEFRLRCIVWKWLDTILILFHCQLMASFQLYKWIWIIVLVDLGIIRSHCIPTSLAAATSEDGRIYSDAVCDVPFCSMIGVDNIRPLWPICYIAVVVIIWPVPIDTPDLPAAWSFCSLTLVPTDALFPSARCGWMTKSITRLSDYIESLMTMDLHIVMSSLLLFYCIFIVCHLFKIFLHMNRCWN